MRVTRLASHARFVTTHHSSFPPRQLSVPPVTAPSPDRRFPSHPPHPRETTHRSQGYVWVYPSCQPARPHNLLLPPSAQAHLREQPVSARAAADADRRRWRVRPDAALWVVRPSRRRPASHPGGAQHPGAGGGDNGSPTPALRRRIGEGEKGLSAPPRGLSAPSPPHLNLRARRLVPTGTGQPTRGCGWIAVRARATAEPVLSAPRDTDRVTGSRVPTLFLHLPSTRGRRQGWPH